MFTFRKPSAETVRKFLDGQAGLDLTYEPAGATAHEAPARYRALNTRERIGRGRATFDRARAALARWDQFQVGWAEVQPEGQAIRPGATVAVVARRVGLWWLSACRIVYVVDEDEAGSSARYAVACGTLPDHVGTGEERFQVEWDAETDEVWYDISSFSRPHIFLTRLGLPYMRWTQRLFCRQSAAAMLQAMGEPEAAANVRD